MHGIPRVKFVRTDRPDAKAGYSSRSPGAHYTRQVMTETAGARPAETFAEAEDALLSRWPETRLEPSLDRIRAFTELLGDPQATYPVVHLTGTNGKTSTSRMIDTLLRALELRTGRFTSPHLERMTERICLDGAPLTDEEFVVAFNDVAPYTHLVDATQPHPLSFFETIVGMAYAAFADAPVDAAIVEVGMGGVWDATNVADAAVAVVLPVAVDHERYLGTDVVDIAVEKAGIIKAGSTAVLAEQLPRVAEVLLRRAAEVGATVAREGVEFGVVSRVPAVGGQLLSLQGLHRRYDEVFLPLFGAHQAQNAAVALAAVEAFLSDQPLEEELVRGAFAEVSSPGRLEVIRRSPTIAARRGAQPARRCRRSGRAGGLLRASQPLIGVVGVMADKDHEGMLAALRAAPRPPGVHPELHGPGACPPPSSPRRRARSSDPDRVSVVPTAGRRDRRGGRTGRGRARPTARRRAPVAS